jgi:hypothetical protein
MPTHCSGEGIRFLVSPWTPLYSARDFGTGIPGEKAMGISKHSNPRPQIVRALPAWLLNAMLMFASLFGASWSQQAFAISCDITPTTVTTQTGPVNTTLTYGFSAACSGNAENGTITVGSDSTGGASAPTTWSIPASSTTFNVVVTLGPNGGGAATFTVNDDCSDCGGSGSQLITANTASGNCDLSSIAPTTQTAGPGTVLNYSFGVSNSFNCDNAGGSSGTISTTDNTSGALLSQTTFSHVLSGGTVPFTETLGSSTGSETITIQATKNISTTNTLNYTAVSAHNYTLTLIDPASSFAVSNVGTPIPMQVQLLDNGNPVPGVLIGQ